MTLGLLPTDLNINGDHVFIKDYLPTKFEVLGTKRSGVIVRTMLRGRHIDRSIYAKQYPPPPHRNGTGDGA